ncbi:hypothetical protein F5X99DRAFT_386613 [Biscogniauxia marginata]|nr:hypothetical protein F5X99DRAFT_386613 [Biscogniauxia marginata]
MAEAPRLNAHAATPADAGGFTPLNNPLSSLPSPAPSTASSRIAAGLPHPRSKPLFPGSRKEDYARDYVSQRLLHISRRFVKKHGIPDPADEVSGYESMEEVCRDLNEVVDVLWFSGTPSLQIPYLLNVALAFNSYLPSFPPSPRPTFALLKKLDHCFASLLVGYDIRTQDALPGFQRGLRAGLSKTEMVRCKSLADETRLLVAMVMSGEADVDTYDSEDDRILKSATKMKDAPQIVETVKVEDIRDDDDDSDSDNEEPNRGLTAPLKRKADTMADSKEDSISKQAKVEEDDNAGSFLEPAGPGRDECTFEAANEGSLATTNGGNAGQFHWALEDDDESEHETLPNIVTKGMRLPGDGAQTNSVAQLDEDGEGEGDDRDESSSDSDNEKLHLNVGKVYAKTLVQLGKSLGESLINID